MQIPSHVFFNGLAHQAAAGHFIQGLGLFQDFRGCHLGFSAQFVTDSGVLQLCGAFSQAGRDLFQLLPVFNHMAFQHQGMAQPVAHGEQHRVMFPAEAPVIHLHPHVRFHDRCAQVPFRFSQLRLPFQSAQQALSVQFHRIPHRDRINMVSHSNNSNLSRSIKNRAETFNCSLFIVNC